MAERKYKALLRDYDDLSYYLSKEELKLLFSSAVKKLNEENAGSSRCEGCVGSSSSTKSPPNLNVTQIICTQRQMDDDHFKPYTPTPTISLVTWYTSDPHANHDTATAVSGRFISGSSILTGDDGGNSPSTGYQIIKNPLRIPSSSTDQDSCLNPLSYTYRNDEEKEGIKRAKKLRRRSLPEKILNNGGRGTTDKDLGTPIAKFLTQKGMKDSDVSKNKRRFGEGSMKLMLYSSVRCLYDVDNAVMLFDS